MRALAGVRVVTTRDGPGVLDQRLETLGATVSNVPMIEIVDPPDPSPLRRALDDIARFDWVVVTSKHGARRVGRSAASADVRLAAVGSATATELAELAGRPVDIVPDDQTADGLAGSLAALVDRQRVLLAQADRSLPALAERLAAAGADVLAVTAYSTRLRRLSADDARRAREADIVTFASGSAATAWARSVGTDVSPLVVAIGPTTAAAAEAAGLRVTHLCADHSIDGLVVGTTAVAKQLLGDG